MITVLYLNHYKRKEVIAMPRTKGSKNRPKTNITKDYASQIADRIHPESNRGAEEYTEREEVCFEEGRKRSGILGSKEGKGRC